MHIIILVWGFTGILGKLIMLPAEIIVWYRVLIATVGLLILLPLFKVSFRLERKKDLWKLIFVGIITSLHWVTFYKAIALSTASLGVLCLSTTTLHVSWLDPLIMKRRISWLEVLFGLLVIYGIYFVSSDFNPEEYEALAYGLTSELLAGIFSVSNAKLVQTIPSAQITCYEMTSGAICMTIVVLFSNQVSVEPLRMTNTDVCWLLFLGIVCPRLPFMRLIDAVIQLGAFSSSFSMNLEPISTIILAILILNEDQLLDPKF